jgi:hypothetical protein
MSQSISHDSISRGIPSGPKHSNANEHKEKEEKAECGRLLGFGHFIKLVDFGHELLVLLRQLS